MKTPQKGRSVTETLPILPGFIVFEGIDGAGTTTQTLLLTTRLQEEKRPVWLTSEPTTGPIGMLARAILAGEVPTVPDAIAHVFAADRADHLYGEQGVQTHLERGEVVICDRYKYSSLAYQGLDAGMELVRRLNQPFPNPEFLFFVDLSPEIGEVRLARRTRRDIYEHTEFQRRVRDRYLEILDEIQGEVSVHVLDGTLPQESIAQKVWSVLEGESIIRV